MNFVLLRYLEEADFAQMFMDGNIRLNSLGFFWGEHDEPTKNGQIDRSEGIVCPVNARSTADCKRGDDYRYCNLLCCHRLDYKVDNDPADSHKNRIQWQLDKEMAEFGGYVVIIVDTEEFRRRLVKAASREGYRLGCMSIEYTDEATPDRDAFVKSKEYEYQKEWRAVLISGDKRSEPLFLEIGPIDDIAMWCRAEELGEKMEDLSKNIGEELENLANNCDDCYFGNVAREEMRCNYET